MTTTNSVKFKQVSMTFTNVSQQALLQINNTAQVAWSMGPVFDEGTVLELSSSGSSIPLSDFQVTGNTLQIQAASGNANAGAASGQSSFTVNLYIAYKGDADEVKGSLSLNSGALIVVDVTGVKQQTIPGGNPTFSFNLSN